jgi:hypothetical protein
MIISILGGLLSYSNPSDIKLNPETQTVFIIGPIYVDKNSFKNQLFYHQINLLH